MSDQTAKFPPLSTFSFIALDADDTLWDTESYYLDAEDALIQLLADCASPQTVTSELLKVETQNMPLYGYGAKAFTLSLIETTLRLQTNPTKSSKIVQKILDLGRKLIDQPVIPLKSVIPFLETCRQYRMKCIVYTKGDPIDQERKFYKSGLEHYFEQVITTSNKLKADYLRLYQQLGVQPQNFVMIGNSLKSDVLPPIETDAYAIHVPCALNWAHENINLDTHTLPRFLACQSLDELCTKF